MKQNQKIEQYIKLLKKYNETTNIYSKNAYDHLNFHIKDCINVANLIKNEKNCARYWLRLRITINNNRNHE